MPYLTIGDPSCDATVAYALAMIDAGADIMELGIPFSDPTADGPVIQAAMVRAMQNGSFSLDQVFETAQRIHKERPQVPLVFLTYLNPVLTGMLDDSERKVRSHLETAPPMERFLKRCSLCGVAGIVIPDLPFDSEESRIFRNLSEKTGVSQILMAAPNTDAKRLKKICKEARGFIYYVTSMGVTGERQSLPPEVGDRIQMVRDLSGLPVLAGFGISAPDQARVLGKHLDGVIVGSLNHRIIQEKGSEAGAELARITAEFTAALSSLS